MKKVNKFLTMVFFLAILMIYNYHKYEKSSIEQILLSNLLTTVQADGEGEVVDCWASWNWLLGDTQQWICKEGSGYECCYEYVTYVDHLNTCYTGGY